MRKLLGLLTLVSMAVVFTAVVHAGGQPKTGDKKPGVKNDEPKTTVANPGEKTEPKKGETKTTAPKPGQLKKGEPDKGEPKKPGTKTGGTATALTPPGEEKPGEKKPDEKKPPKKFDIVGKIVKLRPTTSLAFLRNGIFMIAYVEGKKMPNTRFAKAYVRVRKDTGVYMDGLVDKDGLTKGATYKDLAVGQEVRVKFNSNVLESDPAQGSAQQIYIVTDGKPIVKKDDDKKKNVKRYDIVGKIVKLRTTTELAFLRNGIFMIAYVEGEKKENSRFAKAYVRIRKDTGVFMDGLVGKDGLPKGGTFKDLKEGQIVRVKFNSNVLLAEVVQASALQIWVVTKNGGSNNPPPTKPEKPKGTSTGNKKGS